MLRTMIFAPLYRLQETPAEAKFLGGLVGLVQLFWGWPLAKVLLLLVIASTADFLIGKEVARRRGTYDPLIARTGVISKGSGVLLVMLVAGVEQIFMDVLAPMFGQLGVLVGVQVQLPGGAIATAFCFVLTLVELESYDQNREELTGKPTPFLRPVLNFFRSAAERVIPAPKGGT